MNKNLLTLVFALTFLVGFSQFEVRQVDDDALITNNQVLNFSVTNCEQNDSSCYWKFKVTNTSSEDIGISIVVDQLINTDGSNFQLCFAGVCVFDVNLNSQYPSTPATLAAGATSEFGNYLWNQNPVNSPAMSWVLRYQAYDTSGNEIGTPLTMTYNYDSNLSTDEFNLNTIKLFPSTVTDSFEVSTSQNLTVSIYDILGKKVKEVSIAQNQNTVDVSDLKSQIYLVRLDNEFGQTTTRKIVKQ